MAQAPQYRNFKDTEQAQAHARRLHLVPSIRRAMICFTACFVLLLAAFAINLAAGVIWFFVAAIGLTWHLGGYAARRRCIHCGHVPPFSSADYPLCEDCRNPKWEAIQ